MNKYKVNTTKLKIVFSIVPIFIITGFICAGVRQRETPEVLITIFMLPTIISCFLWWYGIKNMFYREWILDKSGVRTLYKGEVLLFHDYDKITSINYGAGYTYMNSDFYITLPKNVRKVFLLELEDIIKDL